MVAVKKQSQSFTQSAILVGRQQSSSKLEGLIKETIKVLILCYRLNEFVSEIGSEAWWKPDPQALVEGN